MLKVLPMRASTTVPVIPLPSAARTPVAGWPEMMKIEFVVTVSVAPLELVSTTLMSGPE